jgi:hypothetical protein
MVNVDRVKRKLPSLLIDGNTTSKKHWAARRKIAYRLDKLKRRNSTLYLSIEAKLIMTLRDIEKAVSD